MLNSSVKFVEIEINNWKFKQWILAGIVRHTFGISDFWDRLGGQELIMIGRLYSSQPLTNHKLRLSTKRPQKSLHRELVSIALIVSVTGNYISVRAARYSISGKVQFT